MYRAIAANKRNSVFIILGFIGLLSGLAYAWGVYSSDFTSMVPIILFVIGYTVFQYFAASSIAVAMSGAVPIEKADNPRLWRTVENISISQGMPMPKVYIIPDDAPNAFATGRNPQKSVVAATSGLLAIMDDKELEGVMAHEMGHVKNYDILVSTIVFGLVSAIGIIADFAMRMAFWSNMGRRDNRDDNGFGAVLLLVGIVGSIIAFLIGPLISAAVSRQREYLADATSAEITRFPEGLESALNKLGQYGKPMRRKSSSMAHMYIADPIKPGFIERAFSTHPPIPKRIERLKEIGSKF